MINTVPTQKIRNQKGQGIVEYILLVVIIISFALAISARLFKPINEWAKNYIGDYIYCLLDEGELPGLGGEETIDECDKGFEAFTVAGGRGAKEGEGNNTRGGTNARGSGRSGSGDVVSAQRRGRRGSALGEGFDNNSGGKNTVIDLGSSSSSNQRNNRFYTNYNSGSSAPPKYVQAYGLSGLMEREAARIQKREEKITTVAKTDTPQSFVRGRAKKILIDPPKARKSQDSDFGEVSMPWGEWLRTLLIIVIIVVLVLFIAGQMMQISKSMEKE